MDNELFELCKEVYRRTKLDGTQFYYHEKDSIDFETRSFKRNGTYAVVERLRADYDIPHYTSDYLLEKLPSGCGVEKIFSQQFEKYYYISFMYEFKGTAKESRMNSGGDTPLKALLKLVIALDDSGVKL